MTEHWSQRDPFAAREREKYGTPVPSREYIQQTLERIGKPLPHERVCDALGIEDEETRDAVLFRLKAMCRDGQLISNRKNEFGLIQHMGLIKGRVIGHRDGFGFVKPDEGGSDLFISPRQMRQVFDGDRVLVQELGADFKGRRDGKIVEVLERCTHKLVGRFKGQDGFGYLTPENQRIPQEIMVVSDQSAPAYHDGQLVVAEIVQQPGRRQMAQARVIEVLGDHMAPGMEIQVAIHNYDIPQDWPQGVSDEIAQLDVEVDEAAKAGRVDLRQLPFVTIDGEDAKDFDDAVYAERNTSGGWRLWVAIADVSWYVRPGTELDSEALKRGNSVYFPEYVVPMLPELLSNGLCSLNPQVDRLAMVCEMTISKAGRLSGYRFYEAVINSHARLTYTQVGAMLTEADTEYGARMRREYEGLLRHLENLHGLYFNLRNAREQRGAIDFETTETRILFDETRKIEQIVPVQRNDAHKLIEECMLCANVATARFLHKLKRPAIYRIHEGPKAQKLENLRGFLGELGLAISGGDDPSPEDFQQLATMIENRPDRHLIQTMMLRSMNQAVYSPDNQGHFGLAYSAYTHFTSPIRRYPDLVVHRLIRAALHSEREERSLLRADDFAVNPQFAVQYDMPQMLQLGEHCSMTERRADDATRDVVAWLKCEYMRDQVGGEFDGVVAAVTGFGLFVELDQVFVEGLIHVTGLPSDYYQFDAGKQRLIGERTCKVFRLGDRLRVRVARVDLDERKIDFELISVEQRGRKQSSVRQQLAAGKLGGELPAEKAAKPRRRPAAKGAKDKAPLSAAEREQQAFSAESAGKSQKAKKRKAKAGGKTTAKTDKKAKADKVGKVSR
ncbi:ribonuclease R [Marinobacterium arenosum]|uniref:ribonuclease R n=1 Tax=Marinobacterium arenosum TaxID=2862496 RepID=UPI001C954C8C|nr:ribonuclease R [Marinobacterium arenosum]MBY4675683.1 ribonuclease R [Marinobacterium arenosum]